MQAQETQTNPKMLRNALGLFTTGVAMVSCQDDETHIAIGMTINSFASVSLDPPLILWSLARNSDRFSSFEKATIFTISFLTQEHQEIAKALSEKGHGGNLTDYQLEKHDHFPPSLKGSLGVLYCHRKEVIEGGDHLIFLGSIQEISTNSSHQDPLVFWKGRFQHLLPS